MQQRGRKSVGALTAPAAVGAVALIERPSAPLGLTPEEADVWQRHVDAKPADWFDAGTWGLLKQLCRHEVAADRIGQMLESAMARDEVDVGEIDKLLAMQAKETAAIKAMSAAMRLSQQSSRTDGSAATAKRRVNGTIKRPWQ